MELTRGRDGFHSNKPSMGQQSKDMFQASDSSGVGPVVPIVVILLTSVRNYRTYSDPGSVDLMLLYR